MFERVAIGRISPVQNEYCVLDPTEEGASARDGVEGSGFSVGAGVSAQGLEASRLETQHDLGISASLSDVAEPVSGALGPRTRAYLAAYQAWQVAKQHEMELQLEAQSLPWYALGSPGGGLPLYLRAPLEAAIRCAREAQDVMLTAYMNLMASEEGTSGLC